MPITLEDEENELGVSATQFAGLYNLKEKCQKQLDKWSSYRFLNVPLINYTILIIFGYLLVKLSFRYHKLYTKSSLVATIATNVVLYGIADTCAQSIPGWIVSRHESVLTRLYPHRVQVTLHSLENGAYSDISADNNNEEMDEIRRAFADYGDDGHIGAKPYDVEIDNGGFIDDQLYLCNGFNARRFIGFVFWGFIMAFIQVLWYMFLNSMFNDMPTIVIVLERALVDQLCFSPISLACFFAYSTIVIERGTKDDYIKKMIKLYITTLFVSFSVWFPVQFINFLVMPRNLQVPFSSTVSMFWNCFLSYRNAQSSMT